MIYTDFEEKLLKLLIESGTPLNILAIQSSLNITREEAFNALKSLEERGDVERITSGTICYYKPKTVFRELETPSKSLPIDEENLLNSLDLVSRRFHSIMATIELSGYEYKQIQTNFYFRKFISEYKKLYFIHENIKSRYQKLNQEHVFEIVNISNIISDIIRLYSIEAESKELKVELKDKNGEYIIASKKLITRVIANLIDNAVQYYDDDINVREIIIEIENDERNTKISITNYGYVIEEDEYEKIFEYGYRGIHAKKRVVSGIGYGLAEVERIINGHNGTVSFRQLNDINGYLTTFEISIPNKLIT